MTKITSDFHFHYEERRGLTFQYINHYYIFCGKILTFRGNLDLRVAGLCLTCKYPRSLVVLVAIWFCCCFCEPAIFCSSEAFNIPCVCGILRQWFSLTCKTNQYGINLLSRKTLHHAFSISVKLDMVKNARFHLCNAIRISLFCHVRMSSLDIIQRAEQV